MAETTSFQDRMDGMLRLVFRELQSMGGSANGSDVLRAVEPKLGLSDHERGTTSTGAIRWEANLRWHSSDCVKAGYLTKSKGRWTLTEKGVDALKLPAGQLVRTLYRLANEARRNDQAVTPNESPAPESIPDRRERTAAYEKAEELARKEIDARLDDMNEYAFQEMVAELLRAMGYHVPFVAPPGKDGGIDLIAYRDPLGSSPPRIRVQVKHMESRVGAKDIRELRGLLHNDGDVGLFVSSGGFSADARNEVRSSNRHIEMIDQDRLIELWQQHYDKISERGKTFLPLTAVYFLMPDEAGE